MLQPKYPISSIISKIVLFNKHLSPNISQIYNLYVEESFS